MKIYSIILLSTLGFMITACSTATNDYTCDCSYTIGTMTGSETYQIQDASPDEAADQCATYESDLGGNTKCETTVVD